MTDRQARCFIQVFYGTNWIIVGAVCAFIVKENILGGIPSGWFVVFLVTTVLVGICSIVSFVRLVHLLQYLKYSESYCRPLEELRKLKRGRIMHLIVNCVFLSLAILTLVC